MAGVKILRVEDFGAVADGKTDCTEAFKKAIIQANQQGPGVTVQLGKGQYILSSQVPEEAEVVQDISHLEGEDKEDYKLFKQLHSHPISS